jgi:hypothetical protein
MTDPDSITFDAVEALRVYRMARAAHRDAGGEGLTPPALRLDELIAAVEAAGDPLGALAFVVLGAVLTAGYPEEREAALGLLASLPTGAALLSRLAAATAADPREVDRILGELARAEAARPRR